MDRILKIGSMISNLWMPYSAVLQLFLGLSKWLLGWDAQDTEDDLIVDITALTYETVDEYVTKVLWNMEEKGRAQSYFQHKFANQGNSISTLVEGTLEKFLETKFIHEIPHIFGDDFVDPNIRRLMVVEAILLKESSEYTQLLKLVKDHYVKSLLEAAESIYAKDKMDAALAALKQEEEMQDLVDLQKKAKLDLENLRTEIGTLDADISSKEKQISLISSEKETFYKRFTAAGRDRREQEANLAELKKKKAEIEAKILKQKEEGAWVSFKHGLRQSDLNIEHVKSVKDLRNRLECQRSFQTYVDVLLRSLVITLTTGEKKLLNSFVAGRGSNGGELKNELKTIVDKVYPERSFKVEMHGSVAKCDGRILVVSEILGKIHSRKRPNIDEIQIVASHTIIIDKNISESGVNVALSAPRVVVLGSSITIDTSGNDGRPLSTKDAASGSSPGWDGVDGDDGNPGESAGNVMILAQNFEGIEKLYIKAKGGKGSNGQNGGDGANGTDGKFGTDGNAGEKPGKVRYGECVFSSGTSGSDGGNGGRGGNAGAGGAFGHKGDITVRISNRDFSGNGNFESRDGKPGKPGKPGKGGEGGSQGKDGTDHCYIRSTNALLQFTSWEERRGDLVISRDDGIFSREAICRVRRHPWEMWRNAGLRGKNGMAATTKSLQNQANNSTKKRPIDLYQLHSIHSANVQGLAQNSSKLNPSMKRSIRESEAEFDQTAALLNSAQRTLQTQSVLEHAKKQEFQKTEAKLKKVEQQRGNLKNLKSSKESNIQRKHQELNELATNFHKAKKSKQANEKQCAEISMQQEKVKAMFNLYQERVKVQEQVAERIVRVVEMDLPQTVHDNDMEDKPQVLGVLAFTPSNSSIPEKETNKSSILIHYMQQDGHEYFCSDGIVFEMEEFLQNWESNCQHLLGLDTIRQFFKELIKLKGMKDNYEDWTMNYISKHLMEDAVLCEYLLQQFASSENSNLDFKKLEELNLPAPSNRDNNLVTCIIQLRATHHDDDPQVMNQIQSVVQNSDNLAEQLLAEMYGSVLEQVFYTGRLKAVMDKFRVDEKLAVSLLDEIYSFYSDFELLFMEKSSLSTFCHQVCQAGTKEEKNYPSNLLEILPKALLQTSKSATAFDLIWKIQKNPNIDAETMTTIMTNIFQRPSMFQLQIGQLWDLAKELLTNPKNSKFCKLLDEEQKSRLFSQIQSSYESLYLTQTIMQVKSKTSQPFLHQLAVLESALESHFSTISYPKRMEFYNDFCNICSEISKFGRLEGLEVVSAKLSDQLNKIQVDLGISSGKKKLKMQEYLSIFQNFDDKAATFKICFDIEREPFTNSELAALGPVLESRFPPSSTAEDCVRKEQNFRIVHEMLKERMKKVIQLEFKMTGHPENQAELDKIRENVMSKVERLIKSSLSLCQPSDIITYVAYLLYKFESSWHHKTKNCPDLILNYSNIEKDLDALFTQTGGEDHDNDEGPGGVNLVYKVIEFLYNKAKDVLKDELNDSRLKLAKKILKRFGSKSKPQMTMEEVLAYFLDRVVTAAKNPTEAIPHKDKDLLDQLQFILLYEVSEEGFTSILRNEGWKFQPPVDEKVSKKDCLEKIQEIRKLQRVNQVKKSLMKNDILSLIESRFNEDYLAANVMLEDMNAERLAQSLQNEKGMASFLANFVDTCPLEILPLFMTIVSSGLQLDGLEESCNALLLDYLQQKFTKLPLSATSHKLDDRLGIILSKWEIPLQNAKNANIGRIVIAAVRIMDYFTGNLHLPARSLYAIYVALDNVMEKCTATKETTLVQSFRKFQNTLIDSYEKLIIQNIVQDDIVLEVNFHAISVAAKILLSEKLLMELYHRHVDNLGSNQNKLHPTAILENLRNDIVHLQRDTNQIPIRSLGEGISPERLGQFFHLISLKVIGGGKAIPFPSHQSEHESLDLTGFKEGVLVRILENMGAIKCWCNQQQPKTWEDLMDNLDYLILTKEETIMLTISQKFGLVIHSPLRVQDLEPFEWLEYIQEKALKQVLIKIILSSSDYKDPVGEVGINHLSSFIDILLEKRFHQKEESSHNPETGISTRVNLEEFVQKFYRTAFLSEHGKNLSQFLHWMGLLQMKMCREKDISYSELGLILDSGTRYSNISSFDKVEATIASLPVDQWTFALYAAELSATLATFESVLHKKSANVADKISNGFKSREMTSRMGQLLGMMSEKLKDELNLNQSKEKTSKNKIHIEEIVVKIVNMLTENAAMIESCHMEIGSKLSFLSLPSWAPLIRKEGLIFAYGKHCGQLMSQMEIRFAPKMVSTLRFKWEELRFNSDQDKWAQYSNLLEKILSHEWIFDEDVLSKLSTLTTPSAITKCFLNHTKGYKPRCLSPNQLLDGFRSIPTNSGLPENFDSRLVEHLKMIEVRRFQLTHLKNKAHFQAWAREYRPLSSHTSTERTIEILAHISAAVFQTRANNKSYYPRDIQLLALLIFLNQDTLSRSNAGRLAQISTGEGKTLIIAMLAITLALRSPHANINVVTSSPVLAEQNAQAEHQLFSYFNVSVGNNCDKAAAGSEKERTLRYQNRVIYGDVSTFQGDILLTQFYSKNITAGRVADIVIVDEVDSMLLDKGENMLYLSHTIPELSYLWAVFVEIWQTVHAADVSAGSEIDVGLVCKYVRDRIAKGHVRVPPSLKNFVQLRLSVWVKSAYTAKNLAPNDPYILSNPESKGEQIIIMDKDTGVEQMSTEWSNGLMQFIQLKHTAKLSPETLKSVFMSNVSYFKGFDKPGSFFGLSGTLGSDPEKELLAEVYGVQVFIVPRFMSRHCAELEGFVHDSQEAWLQSILDHTLVISKKQAVLLISENIGQVMKISEKFTASKKFKPEQIYLYTSSFDANFHEKNAAQGLKAGDIVMSTNLAGRGTDLLLSKELETTGLHVILTFMPTNARVEEQAFGRTARAGQRGTNQFIILHHLPRNRGRNNCLQTIKDERDSTEVQRIGEIRSKTIPKICIEEKLFKLFGKLYEKVEDNLKSGENRRLDEVETLQLKFLSNHWALWLDGIGEQINALHLTGEVRILEQFEAFRNKIESIMSQSSVFKFAQMPTELVILGKMYECRNQIVTAMSCYDKTIALDPDHAEIAHYYKAACGISLNGRLNRPAAIFHLSKAHAILKRQVEELTSSAQVVKHVTETRSKLGFASSSNKFQKQVENKCKVLHVHINAVEEAIGSIIDIDTIGAWSCVNSATDKTEAKKLFDLFRHSYIMTNYKLSENVKIADGNVYIDGRELKDWTPKLLIYQEKVVQRLEEIMKGGGGDVEPDGFQGCLVTQDSYWESLVDVGIIDKNSSKVEEYLKVGDFDEDSLENGVKMLKLGDKDSASLQEFLHENKGEELDDELLALQISGQVNAKELKRIKDSLLRHKLTAKFYRKVGKLSTNTRNAMAWDEKLKCWNFPNSPQHLVGGNYGAIFQFLIQQEPDEEESGQSLQLKETLTSTDLPLFESAQVGSRHIWSFLKSSGVILDCKMLFNSSHSHNSSSIEKQLKVIHKFVENSSDIKTIFDQEKEDDVGGKDYKKELKLYRSNLEQGLVSTIGTLRKMETAKLSYSMMEDAFKNQELPDDEVREVEEKGFSQIISFQEEKSWWNWGAVVVGIFGVLQVIAGVALLTCTFGAASFLSAALIGEGISDILFAVEATMSGNFSWKSYGTHKALSLAITLTTAGIGAYFARGAQAASVMGRSLWPILKSAGKIIGRRLIEFASYAISNTIVEKVLTYLKEVVLDTFQNKIKSFLFGGNATKRFISAMESLFHASKNKSQAIEILNSIWERMGALFQGGGFLDRFQSFALNFASSLGSNLDAGFNKMFSHGQKVAEQGLKTSGTGSNFIQRAMRIKMWVDRIFKAVKWANIFNPKIILEVSTLASSYLNTFADKINKAADRLNQRNETVNRNKGSEEKTEFDQYKNHLLTSTQNEIVDSIASKVQRGLIQPHLVTLLNRTIQSVGTSAINTCSDYFKTQSNLNANNNNNSRGTNGAQTSSCVPQEIHNNEVVANSSSVSVAKLKQAYGDSATFIRDENNNVLVIRPSPAQFLASINNGGSSNGGFLHLMVIANKQNRPIIIQGRDGQSTTYLPKGVKSDQEPIRMAFDDGHYKPMVYSGNDQGWIPLASELSQDNNLDQNCLWQAALFSLSYSKNQDIDAASKEAENHASVTKYKNDFVKYADRSKTFKLLYKTGVSEIGSQYLGGAKKVPNNPAFKSTYITRKDFFNLKKDLRNQHLSADVPGAVNLGDEKENVAPLGEEATVQRVLVPASGPIKAAFLRQTEDGTERLEAFHAIYTADNMAAPGSYTRFTKEQLIEWGFSKDVLDSMSRRGLEKGHGAGNVVGGLPLFYNFVIENPALNRNVGLERIPGEDRVSHYSAELKARDFLKDHPGGKVEAYHEYHYKKPYSIEYASHSYNVKCYDQFGTLRNEIHDTMTNRHNAYRAIRHQSPGRERESRDFAKTPAWNLQKNSTTNKGPPNPNKRRKF